MKPQDLVAFRSRHHKMLMIDRIMASKTGHNPCRQYIFLREPPGFLLLWMLLFKGFAHLNHEFIACQKMPSYHMTIQSP